MVRLLSAILFPAVKLVYNPKVYFENPSRKSIRFDQPTVVVCNHIAHVDGTVVSYVFRHEKLRHLAAKDRFEQGGFVKWYLENSGCIPIDRKNISTEWVHASIRALRVDGDNIAIYPEGRHGKNREILPFHSGVTMIAALAQCPVVLLYNDGPYRFGKRCRMMVSEPFVLEPPTAGMTADYVQKQTDFLHARMLELQQEFLHRIGEK